MLLYLQVLVAVVVLFPLFWLSPKVGPNLHNAGLVLYACLLASMLAPLAWMRSVATLGPSRTTLFFNLLPLITALIAAAVLHGSVGLVSPAGRGSDPRWGDPLGTLDHSVAPPSERDGVITAPTVPRPRSADPGPGSAR